MTPTTGATRQSQAAAKITVFAAASLKESFEELGRRFQEKQAGAQVEFNFAGSPQLLAQLQQGAPAEVVAFADLVNMKKAQDAGLLAGEPVIFAKNRLTIVVPKQNRAAIQTLADLAKPGVKIVIAHENVPVGRYAREVLQRASQRPEYGADFADRVLKNVVSEEVNVKQVLAKVALGEADAGIVYVTDVKAAGADVQQVAIPDDINLIACYPIAVAKNARDVQLAQEFVSLVRSEEGRTVLEAHGFEAVPSDQAKVEGCS
ncbi:MAG: molybdate ABC transporter substrate-binding protein [Thermomicrobium sp.]